MCGYTPKKLDTVIRKSLNASKIRITKCVKYHSSIMEARKFKEIGMTVSCVPCNPDQRRFTCYGSHLLSVTHDFGHLDGVLTMVYSGSQQELSPEKKWNSSPSRKHVFEESSQVAYA
jgi:hypothetical protein